MGKNFASFHVIGASKKDLVSTICPDEGIHVPIRALNTVEEEKIEYLKRILGNDFIIDFKKKSFEIDYLAQQYIGVQSENAYSVFSSVFSMDSLYGRIRMCFDYDGAPDVVGFATDYESIIRLFLYQNRKIVTNLCFCIDSEKLPQIVDLSEYDIGYFNLEKIGSIFNFTSVDLKKIIHEHNDFYTVCEKLRWLFGLPFNMTYEEIISNMKKYNAENLC